MDERHAEPGLTLQYKFRGDATESAATTTEGMNLSPAGAGVRYVANRHGEAGMAAQVTGHPHGTQGFLRAERTTGLPTGRAPRSFCLWAQLDHGGQNVNINWLQYGEFNKPSGALVPNFGNTFFKVSYWARGDVGGGLVPDGGWHHYAVVYDGDVTIRGYIDGKVAFTAGLPTPLDTSAAGPFMVGAGSTGTWAMEDLRVYSRALSDAEVARLVATDTTVPSAPVIVRYRFDGDAKDSSGNGFDGDPVNIDFVTGRSGKAAGLNGNTSRVRAYGAIVNALPTTGQAFSASVWVNPTNYLGANNNNSSAYVLHWGVWGQGFHVAVTPDGRWWVGNFGNPYEFDARGEPGEVPLNAWTHLAFTWDGTTATVYRNGQEAKRWTPPRLRIAEVTELIIGTRSGDGDNTFAGAIDEFTVFRAALSAADVARLYADPR